jgi:hypothetical protein
LWSIAIWGQIGLDAVQKEVKKNTRLLARWSARWNWVKRSRAYDAHLDGIMRQGRETELAKQSRRIASAHDVLQEVSAIALAPLDQFVKVAGKSKRVRLRLGDKLRALYFMGQYWRLLDRGGYSALEDDVEKAKMILAKLAGTKPHLLPPANDNDVDGELLEVDDDVARRSPKLSGMRRRHGHLQRSTTEELIGDPEEVLSKPLGIPKASLPSPRSDDPNDVIEVDVVDESEERSLALARKTTALSAPVVLDANKEAKHDSEEQPESELPQTDGPSELMTPDEKTQVAVGEFKSLYSEKANGQRTNGLTGYRKLIRQWL